MSNQKVETPLDELIIVLIPTTIESYGLESFGRPLVQSESIIEISSEIKRIAALVIGTATQRRPRAQSPFA